MDEDDIKIAKLLRADTEPLEEAIAAATPKPAAQPRTIICICRIHRLMEFRSKSGVKTRLSCHPAGPFSRPANSRGAPCFLCVSLFFCVCVR